MPYHVPVSSLPLLQDPPFVFGLVLLGTAIGYRTLCWLRAPLASIATLERGVLSAGIGLGLLQYLVFGLGCARLLSPRAIALGLVLLAAAFVPDMARVLRGLLRALRRCHRPAPWIAVGMGILVLALSGVLLQALCPCTDADGLGYHLRAPKQWLQWHAMDYLPTLQHTNSPMGVEMLFTLALATWSDTAAKLIHFALGLLMLTATYALGCRLRGPAVGFGAAAFAVLALPNGMQLDQFASAYIDLGVGFEAVCAVLAWVLWRQTKLRAWLLCAALCAGFTLTFKLTGCVLGIALSLLIFADQKSGIQVFRYSGVQEKQAPIFNVPHHNANPRSRSPLPNSLVRREARSGKGERSRSPLPSEPASDEGRGDRGERRALLQAVSNKTQPTAETSTLTPEHLNTRTFEHLIFLLFALLPALPWLIRAWLLTGNPVYPFLAGLFPTREWSAAQGAALAVFNRYYLWGSGHPGWSLTRRRALLLGAGVAILLCTALLHRRMRDPLARRLLLLALLITLLCLPIVGLYLRFYLPFFPLYGLLLFLWLEPALSRLRPLQIAVPILMALNGLLYFRTTYPPLGMALAVAAGRLPRALYLRQALPSMPLWTYANAHLPPDARLAVVGFSQTYYCDRACYIVDPYHPGFRLQDWDLFLSDIRRHHIGYLVVAPTAGEDRPYGPDYLPARNQFPFAHRLAARYGRLLFTTGDLALYQLGN